MILEMGDDGGECENDFEVVYNGEEWVCLGNVFVESLVGDDYDECGVKGGEEFEGRFVGGG